MKEDFVLPEKWCILSKGKEHHNELLLEWLKNMEYEYPDWDGDDYYYHVYKSDISANKDKNRAYDQLTDEQFKKYVLCIKEQQKEIVGWKLNNPEYGRAVYEISKWAGDASFIPNKGVVVERLKQAGVLDLWFEPVLKKEEEFKVGDWVTHIGIWDTEYDGLKTYKISRIDGGYIYVDWAACPTANSHKNSFRLATPEEIAAAQTPQITINGYNGEFFSEYVKFGCAEIDKDLIINLYNTNSITYRGTRTSFESVTIGKGIFSKEQIKAIAEYYLNKK